MDKFSLLFLLSVPLILIAYPIAEGYPYNYYDSYYTNNYYDYYSFNTNYYYGYDYYPYNNYYYEDLYNYLDYITPTYQEHFTPYWYYENPSWDFIQDQHRYVFDNYRWGSWY